MMIDALLKLNDNLGEIVVARAGIQHANFRPVQFVAFFTDEGKIEKSF